MKEIKMVTPVLFMLILLVNSPPIQANPDTQVDLRLYKGSFTQKSRKNISVTTSYSLKPMYPGTIILDSNLKEEKDEIKKVFNLQDLKLITQAKWGWKKDRKSKRTQVVSLDNREFLLQFSQLEKIDNFKLEVIEKSAGKRKKLLEAEIILPQQKTSIFGFENSTGTPYFVSLQRGRDRKIVGKESLLIASIKRPKLIRRIIPKYPKEASREQISGEVVMECTTDIYGRVTEAKVIDGHPILSKAAAEAIKQWVYEPYIVNNKPRKVKFSVTITFHLKGKEKDKAVKSLEKISKKDQVLTPEQLIKNIKAQEFSGEPMDFEFENAELKNVIEFLSKITNMKMSLGQDINAKVSCKFRQIPWDKALATFLKDNRLELILEGDQLKIRKLRK